MMQGTKWEEFTWRSYLKHCSSRVKHLMQDLERAKEDELLADRLFQAMNQEGLADMPLPTDFGTARTAHRKKQEQTQ